MIQYRKLSADEICPKLWQGFVRRQAVRYCWRRQGGEWRVQEDPFIDDWSREEIAALAAALKKTALGGGLVLAAFENGVMKGFASVEPEPFGKEREYLDLSNLHVSEELRGKGIGTALFGAAKQWAGEKGARKLYISAHSAVESVAFYQKMGCVDALFCHRGHVEAEPCDRQLECAVQTAQGVCAKH